MLFRSKAKEAKEQQAAAEETRRFEQTCEMSRQRSLGRLAAFEDFLLLLSADASKEDMLDICQKEVHNLRNLLGEE